MGKLLRIYRFKEKFYFDVYHSDLMIKADHIAVPSTLINMKFDIHPRVETSRTGYKYRETYSISADSFSKLTLCLTLKLLDLKHSSSFSEANIDTIVKKVNQLASVTRFFRESLLIKLDGSIIHRNADDRGKTPYPQLFCPSPACDFEEQIYAVASTLLASVSHKLVKDDNEPKKGKSSYSL